MEKLSSCELIAFRPDAHEVGTDPVFIRRRVKCTEKTVGMQELYQAYGTGLRPEKKLLIPYDKDYRGERDLDYEGERWKVIRADSGQFNGWILVIQRAEGNSGDATAPASEVTEVPEVPEPDGTEETPAEVG